MYQYPVWLEVFILTCTIIYTHILHVRVVKSLVRLSACAAASKHVHLIEIEEGPKSHELAIFKQSSHVLY